LKSYLLDIEIETMSLLDIEIETMPPAPLFLDLPWMRALVVPDAAASAGRLTWIYLLSRLAYPLAFHVGHPLLQLSTQPGYLIVWGQLADIAMQTGEEPPAWWVLSIHDCCL